MLSETHLVPIDRRHMCSRLLYLNTILNNEEFYSAEVAEELLVGESPKTPPFEYLQKTYFYLASQEALREGESENFLERLNTRFGEISESLLSNFSILLERLKVQFQEEISKVSCSNCISNLQNRFQPEPLGNSGCYLNQLRFFFEIASEAALNYYSRFTNLKDVRFPLTTFNTEKHLSHDSLHGLPISYSVGGKTTFCSIEKQCWSAVTLGIKIEDFDLATYLALPYCFFHECFAHIFHGIYPNSLNRMSSEPYDSFTEGWMDYIAFKIFELVIEKKSFVSHPTTIFSNDQHNHGYQYHFARYDTSNSKYSINAPLIKQGQSAANKLRWVLETLPFSKDRAWEILFQISFDLNMSREFDQAKRMDFVTIIDNLAQPNARQTPRHLEITRIIQKYLYHQKLNVLINEILSLKVRLY